jgi:hypothetical protein
MCREVGRPGFGLRSARINLDFKPTTRTQRTISMTRNATRTSILLSIGLAAVLAATDRADAIGFVLGESKEELKLDYDLSVTDHGTGRVTLVFTLADEGRLAPLDEVQLAIPAEDKNEDGGHRMDLVVSIDMLKTEGGKWVGRVHLRKEWAERATIRLNTHTLDGKVDPETRLHYVIPVAEHMRHAPQEVAEPPSVSSLDASAATDPLDAKE